MPVWEGSSGEQAAAGAISALKTSAGKTILLRKRRRRIRRADLWTAVSTIPGHTQAGVVAAWEEDGSIYAAVLAKR